MNINKKVFLIIFSTMLLEIAAQEAVVTLGAEITDVGGSISYTIGQIVYIPMSGTSGSIVPGVQQSVEINVLDVDDIEKPDIEITVYPNPMHDHLIIELQTFKQEFDYLLYDTLGREIKSNKIQEDKTVISLQDFPDGTYFLKVYSFNKTMRTFQIIKASKN
ncbi:T9SS type A sorting domain-containing protein [uncultured Aquimarina sp.]|uniref:T9SS type A sorting domain-containing protein n=1 Tax=uncultured Aquimarina sp. TaxID=575652 RepID=UPI00262A7FAC|nr:T9SS type A sorting domain-containing protein [uncultured Aquimarina sp.]